MSATFPQVRDYATEHLPGLCIGITEPHDVNWVAALLRRINYCPAPADLGDTHMFWATTLTMYQRVLTRLQTQRSIERVETTYQRCK
jgi:hypothetical protein